MTGNEKINSICNEAKWFFIKKGYHNTQMADIAGKAGISVGSVYRFFSGKKSLFQFIILNELKAYPDGSDSNKPVKEFSDEEFKDILKNHFDLYFKDSFKDFNNLSSFSDFISDNFNFINEYGTAFLVFERNAMDFKDICNIYYNYRLNFLDYFEKCMEYFQKKKEIRVLKNTHYHARFIIENLSLWGMHIKYDIEDIHTSPDTAREVVLDAITHAYCI